MVVVVVGVPVVVISPVFLLSNKLPQTVYILFPLNGPDEDQQESHRKGDSTYCSFVHRQNRLDLSVSVITSSPASILFLKLFKPAISPGVKFEL